MGISPTRAGSDIPDLHYGETPFGGLEDGFERESRGQEARRRLDAEG